MSFSRLPNETLQLICDMCHRADQAYEARIGEEEDDSDGIDEGSESSRDWWGRSLSAVSMVNAKLRSMAVKYLFETLRFSKARESIFQHSILLSYASCFTRIAFDIPSAFDQNLLSLLIALVVPLLPNLRAIIGLNAEFIFNSGGEVGYQGSVSCYGEPEEVPKYLEFDRMRKIILKLAAQITHWELKLHYCYMEPLLSQNSDGITHLTIDSRGECFDILDTDSGGYPELLASLPNLQSLTILQGIEGEGTVIPVGKAALSTSYPFSSKLRSLVLDLEAYLKVTTPKEFKFIALFPNLRYLKMTFRSRELSQLEPLKDEPFTFPNLRFAEFVDCPFTSLSILLSALVLPSITELQFSYPTKTRSKVSFELQALSIVHLFKALDSFTPSLRQLTVELPFRDLHLLRLRDNLLIDFHSRKSSSTSLPPASLAELSESNKRLIARGVAAQARDSVSESSTSSNEESKAEEDAQMEEEESEIIRTTCELASWVSDRAETIRIGKDNAGATELLGLLKEVKSLKDWIED
ncbi:hypothetical protein JCM3765_005179 [Sporobolomyces pararoseus]